MYLLRQRRISVSAILAVVVLSASACLSSNTTDTLAIGRVQVLVTDSLGVGLSGVSVDLTLTDKLTIWRATLTTTDGTAEFAASEGGVLVQNYLVHVILPIQYSLSTGDTNDKPVTPVANETVIVKFKLAKTGLTPPS
jgi:hypothetical protein